jgi:hypothetical protein
MLSEQAKAQLLKSFPPIELSYETITHKNVHFSNYTFAIPEGKKSFAWFNSTRELILMDINLKTKQITDMQIENCVEDKNKISNTVFYGTVFEYNEKKFFCIEDVPFFEGKNICNYKICDKLDIISNFLSIKNFEKKVFFGLPLIFSKFSREMNLAIKELPYKISSINFYTDAKPRNSFVMKYSYRTEKEKEKEESISKFKSIIFQVKPDLQNDIYHLYVNDNSELREYDIAYICDYKTSVKMNGLFRNIKENVNLDALEESDDEEEFENERIDKFVDLNKTFFMRCSYNYKFKKWMPIEVKENASLLDVVKKNDLIRLEKNNY